MNYPAKESAQGLASLGRYGDTMLVHMNPKEVAGLQQLAMSKGGSLTINPDTGMPEAFLGALFDFAAPIVGGYFGMNPWLMAGIMGGKSLVEGDDPLEAAMSAFGGYSGAKLGSGIKDFSTPAKIPTAELNTIEQATKNIEAMDPSNLMQADKGFGLNQGIKGMDTSPFNKIASGVQAPNLSAPGTLSGYPLDMRQPFAPATGEMGVKDIAFSDTFNPPQVTVPNALEAVSPVGQFGTDVGNVFKDPTGFAKQIGEGDALTGAAKIGMYTASPFMEGMMQPEEFRMGTSEAERYDPNRRLYLGNDTGLRLLPNLNLPKTAKEGGEIKAYALGGSIASGGIRDLYGNRDDQLGTSLSTDGYGLGRLSNLANEQAMTQAQTRGYADGGDVSTYRQDQEALNLNELPTLNTVTGEQIPAGGLSALNKMDFSEPVMNRLASVMLPSPYLYQGSFKPNIGKDKQTQEAIARLMTRSTFMAKGGYLNGDGDGMSDSIPATIEGKQPARLADGEFVIPADVVSHLGNGSSKAGSKRLYAMLDKVRQARTGTKKQGKEINPAKYMPA